MPKIKKAVQTPWIISAFGLVFLLVVVGCGSGSGGNGGENVDTMGDEPLDSMGIGGRTPEIDSRLIFFALKGQPGQGYEGVNGLIEEQLHNHMAWMRQEEVATISADSSLAALRRQDPDFADRWVHKFFSTGLTNELRIGDVQKIQVTWQDQRPDGRPTLAAVVFGNRQHTWTRIANPGAFSFPSYAQTEPGAILPTFETLARNVADLIVRLSYKFTSGRP